MILFTSETGKISSTWNLKNLAVCYESDAKSRDWAGRPRNLPSISDTGIFHFSSFPEGPIHCQGKISLSFKAAQYKLMKASVLKQWKVKRLYQKQKSTETTCQKKKRNLTNQRKSLSNFLLLYNFRFLARDTCTFDSYITGWVCAVAEVKTSNVCHDRWVKLLENEQQEQRKGNGRLI